MYEQYVNFWESLVLKVVDLELIHDICISSHFPSFWLQTDIFELLSKLMSGYHFMPRCSLVISVACGSPFSTLAFRNIPCFVQLKLDF